MWETITLVYILVGSFVIGVLTTWLLVRHSNHFGLDSPDSHRKQHHRPISRLGGLAIFTALCAGFLALAFRLPEFLVKWRPIFLANALMFSIGFLDDLKPLGAKIKLTGQIGCALILYSFGVSIDIVSNPFGEGSIEIGWWSLPVTLLWLIAIPNIINLIDGMDGLATGFGMFLCLTLAVIGHFSDMPDVSLVAMVMVGALAGFLVFNLPPAQIFLGDGGAYLIGFFIASVSLMSSNKGSIIASLLVIMVALGVPILDTLFAILRRAIRGMPVFRADAEHIHHRLITLGYSKGQALAVLYTICAVLSLAGISILVSQGMALPVVAAAIFMLAIFAARYLGYVRNWRNLRAQLRDSLERRRLREYVRAQSTLLEMEVERQDTVSNFLVLLNSALKRLDVHDSPGPGLAPLKLKCARGERITLYRPDTGLSAEEWQYRGEMLEPAFSSALEKWGDLPGFAIIRPDSPGNTPAKG